MPVKVQFLTSGASATRPADWNNANNTVECIGGGSTGGGGYSRTANVTLSGTFNYAIGAGSSGTGTAGDTWCQGTVYGDSACGAKGAAGHTGGQAASGRGDVKFSGGSSTNADAVGGGGAAGPHGDGANGAASPTSQGGGGGGADGGGNGNTDGTGGTNRLGSGAGAAGTGEIQTAVNGQPGTNGGGGGGGKIIEGGKFVDDTSNGGDGSFEVLWTRTETSPGQTAGSGSGGGGSGSEPTGDDNGDGGAGGLYGGGGGRAVAGTDGAGQPGIVILTWTPTGGSRSVTPAILG